ncbi:MAG: hypothetical protein QW548_03315, partial [Candidatus Aenigmatarchaeota archaeon]
MKGMRPLSAAMLSALLVAIASFAALPASAQPPNYDACSGNCTMAFGALGTCVYEPFSPVAGKTPLTLPGRQLCAPGGTCYCEMNPSAACDIACRAQWNRSGSCAQPQNCIGGVGTTAAVQPMPGVSCGPQPYGTAGAPVCCCMAADPRTQSELDSLSAVAIWPMEKECRPIGGTDFYSVRIGGIWTGGQALRIDVYGAGTQVLPALGEGYPGALLHGVGWFSEARRVPRAAVAASNNMLRVRYTIIPYPNQQLLNMYLQSMVAQTPYATYAPSGYVPGVQSYPAASVAQATGGLYSIEDVIACEVTGIPAPSMPAPLEEGPAPIEIERISCSPAGPPFNPTTGKSYQNPWHLVDLDERSWFQFNASGAAAAAPAPTVTIPAGGTGARGSAPTFSATGQASSASGEVFTSLYPFAAFAQTGPPASCTLRLKDWLLSDGTRKPPEVYGLELATWGTDPVQDGISAVQVIAGGKNFALANERVSTRTDADGRSYWVKTYAFADANISVPLKGRDIIIYFNYTNATPALRELQLWPELVSVGMSAPSNVALTGWPVTLEGNVTVKEWTDDRGNIAHCVYQWNGSCIGCAGTGCEEG